MKILNTRESKKIWLDGIYLAIFYGDIFISPGTAAEYFLLPIFFPL